MRSLATSTPGHEDGKGTKEIWPPPAFAKLVIAPVVSRRAERWSEWRSSRDSMNGAKSCGYVSRMGAVKDRTTICAAGWRLARIFVRSVTIAAASSGASAKWGASDGERSAAQSRPS